MPTSTLHDPGGDADPWRTAVLEPLLRGLAHALANRATAIDGLAAEVAEGGTPARELAAELQAEVARLLAVHRDLRAMLPDGAAEEPLDLRDVAQEAAAIMAYWPAGSPTAATITGDAPAVRVPRSAAVRVLVGMLVHAAAGGGTAPDVLLDGDADIALVRVTSGEPAVRHDAAASPWREQLDAQARAFGGAITWNVGGAELRLPTLRARRAAAPRAPAR